MEKRRTGIDYMFELEEAEGKLLKAGLRNRENEIVQSVLDSVRKRMGEEAAEALLLRTVNSLIEEQDFGLV